MAAVKLGEKIPFKVWVKAQAQWIPRLIFRVLMILVGIVISPIPLLLSKKQSHNRFGEPSGVEYKYDRYPGAGGNGWEFNCVPTDWMDSSNPLKRFIWLFGNDEDGYYGDHYGMWSEIRKRKERKWLSMFLWGFVRNAVNNMSRYTSLYSVNCNECAIEFWGSYNEDTGPYMVKATHLPSGRVYYGFGDEPTGRMMGFKVYPRHGEEPESIDDADRGFTYRPIKRH